MEAYQKRELTIHQTKEENWWIKKRREI